MTTTTKMTNFNHFNNVLMNTFDDKLDLSDPNIIEESIKLKCSHCGEGSDEDHSKCEEISKMTGFTILLGKLPVKRVKAISGLQAMSCLKKEPTPLSESVENKPIEAKQTVEKPAEKQVNPTVSEAKTIVKNPWVHAETPLPAPSAENVPIVAESTKANPKSPTFSPSPKLQPIQLTLYPGDEGMTDEGMTDEDLAEWCKVARKSKPTPKPTPKPEPKTTSKPVPKSVQAPPPQQHKPIQSPNKPPQSAAVRRPPNCIKLDMCPKKDTCPYSHDRQQCFHGANCRNKNESCRYLHPGETTQQYQDRLTPPCRFGSNCRYQKTCQFRHPPVFVPSEKKIEQIPLNINNLTDFPTL